MRLQIWLASVCVLWLLPDTYSGLLGLSSEPRPAPAHTLRSYVWKTFERAVLIAVILYGLSEGWLTPRLTSGKIPYWAYLLAPLLGGLVLVVGNKIAQPWVRILRRFFPHEFERNVRQYEQRSRIFKSPSWMQYTWSLRNGFAEELLMRAFLLGALIQLAGLSPIIAASVMLAISAAHHSGQGRLLGTFGVLPQQIIWTLIYFLGGDLLFLCLTHAAADAYGIWRYRRRSKA